MMQSSRAVTDTGQVSTSAADVYETFFVPALFAQWPPRLADAASLRVGEHVLDIACGTGVLARHVISRVGSSGRVDAIDLNPAMLDTARALSSEVHWHHGCAEGLPFESGSFDKVLCQFGLMFFENQTRALEEMGRVTKAGGRITIAVWASLDQTPGYAAMVDLVADLFGERVAHGLSTPYALGEPAKIKSLLRGAAIETYQIDTVPGVAKFPSISDWVYTDIRGWTLADLIDEEQFRQLQLEADTRLVDFVLDDGSVMFDTPAHIITVNV